MANPTDDDKKKAERQKMINNILLVIAVLVALGLGWWLLRHFMGGSKAETDADAHLAGAQIAISSGNPMIAGLGALAGTLGAKSAASEVAPPPYSFKFFM